MELIIGGAFQGKTAYAEGRYPGLAFTDGEVCPLKDIDTCGGILHFEAYIRRVMEEGQDVAPLADRMRKNNPNLVVVSTEVGYGVVPVDAFDRQYREAVGRVCTELALFSKKVCRVVCGVGMVIKGD